MKIGKKNRYPGRRIILCVLLIAAVIGSFMYFKMQPVIYKYAASTAETLMLNAANESVIAVLEQEGISYNDIVNLHSDGDGYVTSLETDIYKVNYLKSKISGCISDMIDSREYYDLYIPAGTFLGDTYTAGLGPHLKFKMQLTATAFTDFKHEFKSAGINQVLHIITVEIKMTGNLITAGYNKSITADTSVIAAQTVIVGKTPDAFTSVIESGGDSMGGLINDYGATAEH